MWAQIAMAFAKAIAKNMKKASKGEKADSTINPFDLIPTPEGDTANIKDKTGNISEVPVAPADYYKSAQAQIPKDNELMNSFAKQAKNKITSGSGEKQQTDDNGVQYSQRPKIIPVNQPMQYVPGPGGGVIGGQGETMPGYGMRSPQSSIPLAYQQMTQAGQSQQPVSQYPQPGFIRGFTENLLGMPQTPELANASTGRKTAYYAGGLIPNIIMSKLGQPSSAEAASRENLNQYYQSGASAYDPAALVPGSKVPARGIPIKKESPSEQKYSRELDFNASLKDWAGGVVDDETAYKMMSENFPDKMKEIKEYYFMKTGNYRMK